MARSEKRKARLPRTKVQISYNMSRVRSTGSRIEQVLGKALKAANLSPAEHLPVVGRPDFGFPAERVAVFCDSHFWHGYKWKEKSKEIKRNRRFWVQKIEGNMRRDRFVNRSLRAGGWRVIRFWEDQILKSTDKCVRKVMDVLNPGRGGN